MATSRLPMESRHRPAAGRKNARISGTNAEAQRLLNTTITW